MTARPDERTATSNEAALRFLLRADGIACLVDHAALRAFASARPAVFRDSVLRFAGIAAGPTIWRANLLLRRGDGTRAVVTAADLADEVALPVDLANALGPALATVLLDADLRPDDRLLVAGLASWPWLAALTQDIPVILAADATSDTLANLAMEEGVTAVAAPAAWLAEAGLTGAPHHLQPGGIRPISPRC